MAHPSDHPSYCVETAPASCGCFDPNLMTCPCEDDCDCDCGCPDCTGTMASRTLERAADIIDICGWQQGDYGDGIDGYCALGAIRVAACDIATDDLEKGREANNAAVRLLAEDLLGKAEPGLEDCGGAVFRWNDEPGRTGDEVMARLRKVSSECRDRA